MRETGDLNNGRKLLCLRASWSPALFPVRVITWDAASNVSQLRARAGCDNKSIVPSVGHCHRRRAPNTRDRHTRGKQDDEAGAGHPRKTRAAAGLRAEEGGPGLLRTALPGAATGTGGRVRGTLGGGQRFSFVAKL